MVTIHLYNENGTNWVVTYANSGDGLLYHSKVSENQVDQYFLLHFFYCIFVVRSIKLNSSLFDSSVVF